LSSQLEQQQKLCIARLVPLKPEILTYLRAGLGREFTIVIVTHNMAQARRVSEECVFMLLGEIVEYRRTADYVEGRFG
jgi:phosphate transport system ATP-binding protein